MGMWGHEAYDGDGQADWIQDLGQSTGFFDGVIQALRDENPWNARMAAWIVARIGLRYVWKGRTRVEAIDLAIKRLEALKDDENFLAHWDTPV